MNIFIGASANGDVEEKYKKEAEIIADYLKNTNHKIICCADERGMIGKIYQTIKQKNPEQLILTLPKIYEPYANHIKEKIDFLTDTINERTDKSIQNADICLFLPGGIGTIYEILSCIETKRAGEHQSKIFIINSYGFYQPLLAMLDKIYEEKFADRENKQLYHVYNKLEQVLKDIKEIDKR